ncbi:MAG: hypothetical protein AAB721_02815 [Patescibacteria group bacterium]
MPTSHLKLSLARPRGSARARGRAGVPHLPFGAGRTFLAALLLALPAAAHAYELRQQPAHLAAVDGIDREFVLVAGEPLPDAPPGPGPAGDTMHDLEVQAAAEAIKGLLAAGKAGKWLLAVMFALKLVIWLLRLLAKKLPPSGFTRFFTSRWGGWILNFAGSQLGAFSVAAATGTLSLDMALGLVIAGVTTSLAAAGTRELVNDIKPAQAAGLAAAKAPGPTLSA